MQQNRRERLLLSDSGELLMANQPSTLDEGNHD